MDYTMNYKTYESRVSRCCCSMILLASTCVATAHATDAVQWRVSDGGNGHWYAVVRASLQWDQARAACIALGGDLVTLTSAVEADHMWNLVDRPEYWFFPGMPVGPWIGAFQSPKASEPDGGWFWVSGEPFVFDEWSIDNPNNNCAGSPENYAHYWGACCSGRGRNWNDFTIAGCFGSLPNSFAVEWSADCNNDGIVDYGQILDGSFADANSNGELDVCETLLVPAEYATIQAAVDAAVNGNSVLVGPGTYAPFNFNGKTISVRSTAGAATTTISAAGMATSAVQFGEGSTMSTVLSGFKILTGSGSANGGYGGFGGGCFLRNGSGEITDCKFVGSTGGGGYGGGIYADLGAIAVRRCTFTSIGVQHYAGGILAAPGGTSAVVPSEATSTRVLIEDCEFSGCSSWNVGAVWINPDSTPAEFNSKAVVRRSLFWGNSAAISSMDIGSAGNLSNESHIEIDVTSCVFLTAGSNVATGNNWPGTVTNFWTTTINQCVFAAANGSANRYSGVLQVGNSWFCDGSVSVGGAWTNLGGNETTCPSDADCDSDGMNDFHQIVLGLADDLDGNWVIDACEELLVPSQYATIQAAIDAVGPGTFRVVAVAAGTYNETFALNGKDVTVRGAPNNATILDGTGLTTSIVRFTGGEPATTSLEQLVFRNGTSGSLLNPKSTVRLGGAILAHDAFVNLLRCRFEYCSADFGGAAYLYSTTLHAQDCTFTNNNANDEGGAVLSFRTDGGVYSSSFTGNRCGTLSTSSGAAIKLVGGRTSDSIFAIEDCTITGAPVNGVGAAVQQFADSSGVPGVLHIINTSISGHTVDLGAAGLDVIGGMQSCVLSEGTVICNNTVRNVDGPFTIVSNATVCDCLSDMTGDDLVNGFDLSVVLSNWGLTPSSGDGDVNHDGMVDAADLAIALNTWGSCP